MQSTSSYLIGDANTTQTLTASYVASSKTPSIAGMEQAMIIANYTPAVAGSSLYIKAQFSYDGGSTWADELIGSDGAVSNATVTTTLNTREYLFSRATGTTKMVVRLPIQIGEASGKNDSKATQMRVAVKENTTGAFGTVSIVVSTYNFNSLN